MSTTHAPAPEAPATTSPQAARTTGRRSRTTREPAHTAADPTAAVDPVAEEMRAHAIAAVSAPATAAATDPENFNIRDVLTLAALTQQHGPATPEEVDFFLEGADPVKLAADGADVATPRITREGARIWGTISGFLEHATPAQRVLIPAITHQFLRAAIWSTYHAQELYEARQEIKKDIATLRTGRSADSADLRRRSSGHRDVLYAGLLVLAGQKAERRSRIEAIYNKSSQPDRVATSLRDLAELGREVLADPSPAAVHRRRGSLIDENFLVLCERMADEVATTGEMTEALSARPPVLQEEVDLWDGRNLAFIKMAIESFEAARSLDPSMPRIILISLRSFFGLRSRPKKDDPSSTPPNPTSPPSPTSTPATPPTDARQTS